MTCRGESRMAEPCEQPPRIEDRARDRLCLLRIRVGSAIVVVVW